MYKKVQIMESSVQLDSISTDLIELTEFINSTNNVREWKKAQAVRLIIQGFSYKEISLILEMSFSSIARAKKDYKQKGISGLKLKYKGSTSYLSEAQKEAIKNWLLEKPENRNLSELQRHIMENYNVVFKSPQSYYNILNYSQLSWQKANQKNARKNPEAIKKRTQEIREIIQKLQPEIEAGNIAVYALDECHVHGDDVCGYLWGDSKNREVIAINNERERQTYYGALNLLTNQFIAIPYAAGNGENTVKFLKKLKEIHGRENPGQRIMLIWDGASYHRGKEMKSFLSLENDEKERKDWSIICERFPTYAPEENPVEGIWLQVKNFIRRFHYRCKSFASVKRLVDIFFKYQLFNPPNLKNYDAFAKLI